MRRTTHTTGAEASRRTGLAVPLLAVAIGVAYLAAGWSGGDLAFGLFGLVLMTALAVTLVLVRGRSETVQGLLDRHDERLNRIDLQATAFAGTAVIVAILVAFVVDVARGGDGMPYAWLGAVGGLAYVAAVVVARVRG